MNSPPKKASALPPTTLSQSGMSMRPYLFETALSLRGRERRCCVCGVEVRNENLGGFSGRSALSGRLYCPDCEDVGGCL